MWHSAKPETGHTQTVYQRQRQAVRTQLPLDRQLNGDCRNPHDELQANGQPDHPARNRCWSKPKEENRQQGRDEHRNNHMADDERTEGSMIGTELICPDQRPGRVVDEAFHGGCAHPIEDQREGDQKYPARTLWGWLHDVIETEEAGRGKIGEAAPANEACRRRTRYRRNRRSTR